MIRLMVAALGKKSEYSFNTYPMGAATLAWPGPHSHAASIIRLGVLLVLLVLDVEKNAVFFCLFFSLPPSYPARPPT